MRSDRSAISCGVHLAESRQRFEARDPGAAITHTVRSPMVLHIAMTSLTQVFLDDTLEHLRKANSARLLSEARTNVLEAASCEVEGTTRRLRPI